MPAKLWKKGDKSPNPGGRPKVIPEFKARCQRFTDEHVIDAWEKEVLSQGDNWLKASELIVAYGRGKPTQAVEHSGPNGDPIELLQKKDPDELTTEQLKKIAALDKGKI